MERAICSSSNNTRKDSSTRATSAGLLTHQDPTPTSDAAPEHPALTSPAGSCSSFSPCPACLRSKSNARRLRCLAASTQFKYLRQAATMDCCCSWLSSIKSCRHIGVQSGKLVAHRERARGHAGSGHAGHRGRYRHAAEKLGGEQRLCGTVGGTVSASNCLSSHHSTRQPGAGHRALHRSDNGGQHNELKHLLQQVLSQLPKQRTNLGLRKRKPFSDLWGKHVAGSSRH